MGGPSPPSLRQHAPLLSSPVAQQLRAPGRTNSRAPRDGVQAVLTMYTLCGGGATSFGSAGTVRGGRLLRDQPCAGGRQHLAPRGLRAQRDAGQHGRAGARAPQRDALPAGDDPHLSASRAARATPWAAQGGPVEERCIEEERGPAHQCACGVGAALLAAGCRWRRWASRCRRTPATPCCSTPPRCASPTCSLSSTTPWAGPTPTPPSASPR